MLDLFLEVLNESIVIIGFVFIFMILIEYVNIKTKGVWQNLLFKKKFNQYLIAAIFGGIPGCFGAYIAVALFSHRLFSLGAIITTMIATSGDEAFILLAKVPDIGILIIVLLMILGIVVGFIIDKSPISKSDKLLKDFDESKFPIHQEDEHEHHHIEKSEHGKYSFLYPKRIIVGLAVTILIALLSSGTTMGEEPIWVKMILILSSIIVLIIIITSPNHFIEEHIWEHIIKIHLPQIALWTFVILLLLEGLFHFFDTNSLISDNMILVMLLAIIIGIIPQSGPHLVFITLFIQGSIPLSILIANSISQDGHGMLPLLAESKKSFILIKIVNIIVAGIIGFSLYFLGF